MKLFMAVVLTCAACASAKNDSSSRAGHEVVSGAGRIRGGGMRMDVAVGHGMAQAPITTGHQKLKSAATVAP
jgi:hypothetical protein